MIAPVLGIDIGSVSVCVVLMASDRSILHTAYRFHRGMIRETLEEELGRLPVRSLGAFACTSATPEILEGCRRFDSRVCFVDAARRAHGGLGSLLVVGGEKFAALRFDSSGRFASLRASTSCAAGTGSFLDQQAGRLGLETSARLAELALANTGGVPSIASRCSVFAKTDLCHAQQAGYSLEEICDGLCLGLARNIADTVTGGDPLPRPAYFAGGVSRNEAVVRHLERLVGCTLTADPSSHLFGAIGACLNLLAELGGGAGQKGREPIRFAAGAELLADTRQPKSYQNPPLSLHLSDYPEFGGLESALYRPEVVETTTAVEVERYASRPRGAKVEAFLGIDVGSTSTKAVLMAPDKTVLAGFYTRTAGRPLPAVQGILEALDRMIDSLGWTLTVLGAATTGAGRSFVGRVIGADLIMNEITAHARAAYELDPGIDTIIEIGGQDAKFTTLRGGLVTFSQMNTVCAAGTGSFVEEQAAKLGVPLADYSRRAEGLPSPLASDRCTVFMERDINHYLNQKYSVEEILATVLYSVRENYLLKVASEGLIGERICFQGATAKNRALVAAFEEKLQKPIFVSKYCHLTGALGAALSLRDGGGADLEPGGAAPATRFRGVELYRSSIPVRAETCELCPNHCRLRIAEVHGESVAYGFLCGRDYDVERFVNRNTSGFDLGREVRRIHREIEAPVPQEGPVRERGASVTIGIPAALHLYEELPLWKRFFAELSIPSVTSEGCSEALARGKELTGAEFCAPVTALHGHVRCLAEGCDYVFLPTVLEAPRAKPSLRAAERPGQPLRYYCYYTQFSPTVVASVPEAVPEGRCLAPLVDHGSLGFEAGAVPAPGLRPKRLRRRGAWRLRLRGAWRLRQRGAWRLRQRGAWRLRQQTKRELFESLRVAVPDLGYPEVARAYDRAVAAFAGVRRRLEDLYRKDMPADGDIRVVLTGRPYLILPPSMNKGIPEIFGSLGVRAYYQDMIPRPERVSEELKPLLDAFHWHYAVRILETAEACVRTEGLYPVLVTAFKCSPDSFVIEYFRRFLDAHSKPYLILQIDEHDSSVGYETRIEAGVHSFRNHYRGRRQPADPGPAAGPAAVPHVAQSVAPQVETSLDGRVLLLPNFDPLSTPLVAANLQRAGIDARVLEETPLSIQRGMRLNTGQCIPISVITQEMVDYIRKYDLDPARVVLWMGRSNWSCGIHLYPQYIKTLLESQGMGRAGVYVGEISHFDLSPRLVVGTYFAYLFGGLLRRLGCRIRPYELEGGATDRVIAEAQALFVESFCGVRSRLETLEEVLRRLEAIPVLPEGALGSGGQPARPKVAIFGDLYVRDNEVMNQDLIHWIEAAGGEVVTTPYSEYVRIIAEAYFRQWRKQGMLLPVLKNEALLAAIRVAERRYFPLYESYVSPPESYHHPDVERELELFNLRLELSGESYDNALKILHLLRVHPDISLFVQTNPAFCCPSLVTEGMTRKIEALTGVPVVTLTYDGTGAPRNDLVVPYLKYPRREQPGSGRQQGVRASHSSSARA